MINIMENKVLGPLIQQRYEQGLEQGLEQGHRMFLMEQLNEKFGAVPVWARERVEKASSEEIHNWVKKILRSASLDETLA